MTAGPLIASVGMVLLNGLKAGSSYIGGVLPGVFLFWLGLAALLVGLLSFVIAPSWQLQLLMFAVFAAAAVPLWRRVARSNSGVSNSNPFLNKRAEAMIGRVFTLEKPIVDVAGTLQ